MIWDFKKAPELRSAAKRYGFPDEDAIAEALAPRHAGDTITTAQACALVRRYAAERPDLLSPDATAKWTPAELAEVHMTLIRERRLKEAAAWGQQHRDALAVAADVRKRQHQEREHKRNELTSYVFGIEQQLGTGYDNGLRARLSHAERELYRLERQPEMPQPGVVEGARERVASLKADVERKTAEIEKARTEAAAIGQG
jgi:hypothetical protein